MIDLLRRGTAGTFVVWHLNCTFLARSLLRGPANDSSSTS
jgi:hypothetical protein